MLPINRRPNCRLFTRSNRPAYRDAPNLWRKWRVVLQACKHYYRIWQIVGEFESLRGATLVNKIMNLSCDNSSIKLWGGLKCFDRLRFSIVTHRLGYTG